MDQRWLWNFPEGPCSLCCFPPDCRSLTSAPATIGWRANRLEHYWSATLCHTDHPVQAASYSQKAYIIFAAMQRFLLQYAACFGSFCDHDNINLEGGGGIMVFWEISSLAVMHKSEGMSYAPLHVFARLKATTESSPQTVLNSRMRYIPDILIKHL